MRVLIRADAYDEIGAGHVMRCLALAEGLSTAGHDVLFATYCTNVATLQRVEAGPVAVTPLQGPDDHGTTLDTPADAVVLDGYMFDLELQRELRARGRRLLVIDDHGHFERYDADLLLNLNPGAETIRYADTGGARMLLGPEFVLLRGEFRLAAPDARVHPAAARRVLVTLGGIDVENRTAKVAEALAGSALEIRSVRGGVASMRPLMAEADIAVSAGGTTMYELAYMGVPTIACVLADNQAPGVRAFAEARVVRSLGRFERAGGQEIVEQVASLAGDRDAREALSRAAMAAVDGRGVERVVAALAADLS